MFIFISFYKVSIEKAQELSRQLKIPYLECSAKGLCYLRYDNQAKLLNADLV